ncbi:hypothetical protein T01_10095 [Trichinella spiralis]|uniref:Uncharacterized protein n=1 Tax=Trichinella spiralis TaxID=6334 RepID=A0A0V1APC1_TRISP|nr:hypothetical protein T01_10095 [Trichinella spiralis]
MDKKDDCWSWLDISTRNHSSVEEYSELGRRACVIQNAAFYQILQRTIVETASLCCPHAGMVNFGRGMLDIAKTEETFRGRRRGNCEINKIENGRLTMAHSLNALARKVEKIKQATVFAKKVHSYIKETGRIRR